MWYRVFGLSAAEVAPADLLDRLQHQGLTVQAHFRGDDQGWFQADLEYEGHTLTLQRYLASEEGIRSELNTWAAWVELQEDNPHSAPLMQQLISTQQLFVLQIPDGAGDESPLHRLGSTLCRYLAAQTMGTYQMDEQGFFTAEGVLLIAE